MKTKFSQTSGILDQLILEGDSLIMPWGFESSDAYSFFSAETGGVFCEYKILSVDTDNAERRSTTDFLINMVEGSYQLRSQTKPSQTGGLIRTDTASYLKDTFLFDFVTRYRFKKDQFHTGIINGMEIKHTNSNVYYQYPVKEVTLVGDKYTVRVCAIKFQGNQYFEQEMYIRDYMEEWVVHVRLMPKYSDKEVVKLCVSWYNRALPQNMSDLLLSNTTLREKLWLRGEKDPYRFPFTLLSPNAYPYVLIPKDTMISLQSEFSIHETLSYPNS